jgi:hypothetical protein
MLILEGGRDDFLEPLSPYQYCSSDRQPLSNAIYPEGKWQSKDMKALLGYFYFFSSKI